MIKKLNNRQTAINIPPQEQRSNYFQIKEVYFSSFFNEWLTKRGIKDYTPIDPVSTKRDYIWIKDNVRGEKICVFVNAKKEGTFDLSIKETTCKKVKKKVTLGEKILKWFEDNAEKLMSLEVEAEKLQQDAIVIPAEMYGVDASEEFKVALTEAFLKRNYKECYIDEEDDMIVRL